MKSLCPKMYYPIELQEQNPKTKSNTTTLQLLLVDSAYLSGTMVTLTVAVIVTMLGHFDGSGGKDRGNGNDNNRCGMMVKLS